MDWYLEGPEIKFRWSELKLVRQSDPKRSRHRPPETRRTQSGIDTWTAAKRDPTTGRRAQVAINAAIQSRRPQRSRRQGGGSRRLVIKTARKKALLREKIMPELTDEQTRTIRVKSVFVGKTNQ